MQILSIRTTTPPSTTIKRQTSGLLPRGPGAVRSGGRGHPPRALLLLPQAGPSDRAGHRADLQMETAHAPARHPGEQEKEAVCLCVCRLVGHRLYPSFFSCFDVHLPPHHHSTSRRCSSRGRARSAWSSSPLRETLPAPSAPWPCNARSWRSAGGTTRGSSSTRRTSTSCTTVRSTRASAPSGASRSSVVAGPGYGYGRHWISHWLTI